jgi:putative inorganic carbon (HCO3(-)) transporter
VNLSLDIKRLYALAAIFLVYCLTAVYLEVYAALALPVILFVGWIAIIRPKYILYFLAFATPLSVHLIDERYSSINLSIPTEPLIILLFIGILFKLLKSKTLLVSEVTTFLSILMLVDFAWLVITAFSSTMPLISAKYVLMKSWYLGVFYFLLTRFFRNLSSAQKFIWCFIVAVLILSTYTLIVHASGGFSRAYAYTAMRPFLPDHGMYAACISFVVPVLFVFGLHGKHLGYSPLLRGICMALFVYMVIAIALSFTRAAWLSLVISLLIYVVFWLKIRFHHVILIALVGVGGLLANMDSLLTDLSRNKNESDDNIENHLQSVGNVSSDPSNLERLNRWESGLRMWEEKPMMGWGPGTYTFQYGQFQLPHEMTIISTNVGDLGGIHSEYLRPLAESGILGTVLLVCIVLAVFSIAFKHQRTLSGKTKYLSMAVFLGLVTYFAHGVLNNYTEFDKIAVPFYSFMAVLTAIELNTRYAKKDSTE